MLMPDDSFKNVVLIYHILMSTKNKVNELENYRPLSGISLIHLTRAKSRESYKKNCSIHCLPCNVTKCIHQDTHVNGDIQRSNKRFHIVVIRKDKEFH